MACSAPTTTIQARGRRSTSTRAAAISGGNPTGQGQIAQLNNLDVRSAQPASKFTFSADATYYQSGWFGSHEFQTGIYLQDFGYTSDNFYANGGDAEWNAVLNNRQSGGGLLVFRKQIYDRESVRNADVNAHDYALYVQDAWKPMPRLTFNVGLRFDQVTMKDNLFDVQRRMRGTSVRASA